MVGSVFTHVHLYALVTSTRLVLESATRVKVEADARPDPTYQAGKWTVTLTGTRREGVAGTGAVGHRPEALVNLTSSFLPARRYRNFGDAVYLCCCTSFADPRWPDSVVCQLKDVDTEKKAWFRSGCGGHMGQEWHSWMNIRERVQVDHLKNAGSCVVPPETLPDTLKSSVLPQSVSVEAYEAGVFRDKLIPMSGEATMFHGEWYKCCCSSDVVSDPVKSQKVICDMVRAERGDGCRTLFGSGFHSWNNMPGKYSLLSNYGKCAIRGDSSWSWISQ